MKYIEIGQYEVARIEATTTPQEIHGILTRNLNVCLGLAFMANTKLLLMHTDTNIDTDSIAQQLTWFAEEPYTVHIGCPPQLKQLAQTNRFDESLMLTGFLHRLQQSLAKYRHKPWQTLTQHDVKNHVFGITRSGQVMTYAKKPTVLSPNSETRTAINFVNYLCSSEINSSVSQIPLDLAYDLNDWTELPEPTAIAQGIVAHFEHSSNWRDFKIRLQRANIGPILLQLIDHAQNLLPLVLQYMKTSKLLTKNETQTSHAIQERQPQFISPNLDKPQIYWQLQSYANVLQAAKKEGIPNAQYELGARHKRGIFGATRDFSKAIYWYEQAANQLHATAAHNLAVCYEAGEGTNINLQEAVKWYTIAAEHGELESQHNLGLCYLNGRGTAKDETLAVKWFKMAAQQGAALSQYNYGVMLLNGEGVDKNEREATIWLEKAAAQGHQRAAEALNILINKEKRFHQEKVSTLAHMTARFFQGSTAQNWKDYPKNQLTGKYIGHYLQFFTLPTDQYDAAVELTHQLTAAGFDAQLKKAAQNKPSIIVDITTSSPH